jgi:adenine C2-methylase RlmN of 23S rRNA A2503 and tRNA A37
MAEIEFEKYIEPCRKMLQDGESMEAILKYLRNETSSKVASTAVLINGLNIHAEEAKRLIHFSEVWRDVKEHDKKIHEDIFSALDDWKKKSV